jgi:hypothetical protein
VLRHPSDPTYPGTGTFAITDPNDVVLRQARVNGNYTLAFGDQVVVTDRGEKLGQVRWSEDHLVQTMKATGPTYSIPLVQGSACQQKPDEQASRYCHACHDHELQTP